MFSWLAFVQRHRIAFTDTGGHTHKNNLYVWCPFCREGDREKRRLGLHLKSPRWGCWKDERHRGSDPVRLIRALLGCSWQQAVAEAQDEEGVRTPIETLRSRLAALTANKIDRDIQRLHLPREFQSFDGATSPPLSWYRAYLQHRGFRGEHADHLIERYELLAAVGGRYDRRVIIPLHLLDGRLVGFTGRSISKTVALRYDTFGPVAQVLFNGHRAAQEGGRVLAVVEGPVDALKVDYFGADLGLRAVAVLGLGGASKVGLITEVFSRGRYEAGLVLLDATAQSQGLDLLRSLRHLPFGRGRLPAGRKDPGVLHASEVPLLLDGLRGPLGRA